MTLHTPLKPQVNNVQAIVFDMDDTLYPESSYVLSGFRAVANWLGAQLNVASDDIYHELNCLFENGVRGNTFNILLEHLALDQADTLIPSMLTVYREHTPTLRPFPEVPTLLTNLHTTYRLGLVTDGFLGVQQRKLAALGIAQQLDAVVFSDEWGRAAWKPSTKPFAAILKRLNVLAPAAVYVADNPQKDFLGARELGMLTIWLRRPNGEYTHLEPPSTKHAPHLVIRTLAQLPEMLSQLPVGV